ncbi:MAG TPA: transketolase [Sulfurospirillum sp. UBA11407]|nr:MAG TPA: transketolase [Sulfurospirillum sp. UBA11407]
MELQQRSVNIRKNILKIAHLSRGPHTGTALSCVDILSVLYFKVMHISSFEDINRDIFIMSKGHGAMALYATLFEKGYLNEEAFLSYYQNDGKLPAHLDKDTSKAIEVSSGSLGHGLPQALGFAYSKKLKELNSKVYVLMGDGESQEGSVWEAAMLAPKMGLDNLTVLIDRNNLQGYGRPSELVSFEVLDEKFKSFNWDVFRVDGHDLEAIEKALLAKNDKPKVIICDTIKGKGVSFMEDEMKWHYFIVTEEFLAQGVAELEQSL